MDRYILNTVDYNYKTLSHEGFGGVCKYIATPKRVGYSRLLVKHENIQSACNTFMCSRLAELCDVYTPKAYLMSTSGETRRLFPMHLFIVGTEWVEDFSAVDYGNIKKSPALRQQYLGSMALYAMFSRIADTPQFAYSPSEGVFAYDWDEAFDVTDFVIKLCLYNSDAGTEQMLRMLWHFSRYPFESDADLCLHSAAAYLNMDADDLRSSYMQTMERFCKVTEAQVAELTDVLFNVYPMPLIVYYEEYIKILQRKVTCYAQYHYAGWPRFIIVTEITCIQTCLVISNMYLMRNYIETRPRRGMAVFLEVTTILAGHSLALTYSDRFLPILLHCVTLLS